MNFNVESNANDEIFSDRKSLQSALVEAFMMVYSLSINPIFSFFERYYYQDSSNVISLFIKSCFFLCESTHLPSLTELQEAYSENC